MNRLGTSAFALAVLLSAVTVASLRLGGARAEAPTAAPSEIEAPRARCRVFRIDSENGATWDTSDRTIEIGQWVGEQEDQGWLLHDVDFEVGQKATGYPQGYVQVCMRPR